MKIIQINVLFAVTRTKKKRQVTQKDRFKDYNIILHLSFKTIIYSSFLFRPSIVLTSERLIHVPDWSPKTKSIGLGQPAWTARTDIGRTCRKNIELSFHGA